MAAIGVYLIGPPHNGVPCKEDTTGLEKALIAEGYLIKKVGKFNSLDIFLKLASGPGGNNVRCLSRKTLEKLEQMGYRDNTRHYEL